MNDRNIALMAALKAMKDEDLKALTNQDLHNMEIALGIWLEKVGEEYDHRSRRFDEADPDAE